MSFHSKHGKGEETWQIMLSPEGLFPVMAHINYSLWAKASSWLHLSLGNKKVTFIICPKMSGIRIAVNSPNYNNNHNAFLFPYCWAMCLSLPASLKILACSFWDFIAYGKFTWKGLQIDIRQNFLILCALLSTGIS